MANTEAKYDKFIEKLRNAKPVDGNSDLLTDEIMRAIQLKPKNKAYIGLLWVRPLMTAAAIFFLGLFFYQQTGTTNNLQESTVSEELKLTPLHNPVCNTESTLKLPEKRKLLNEYICYMKSNQAENQNSREFYYKYLPKNQ